jgi:RNA polymerase sigma-70 factor, ECF subfamily
MNEQETLLLSRAREGDVDAFADFVRLFERRIRAVLSRLLDDERDIDEAAQDTFVQAWRNLQRFRGEAAPFTWLYRIAVNEALQRTRRKRLEVAPLEPENIEQRPGSDAGRAPAADVEAAGREALAFLTERVRRLPDEARVPLVLRDVEGWAYDEVAAVLDLSVSAVKSRVHRARLQLGREFASWQGDREGGSSA